VELAAASDFTAARTSRDLLYRPTVGCGHPWSSCRTGATGVFSVSSAAKL